MTTAAKKQKTGYQLYCFLTVFFHGCYRLMKKSVKGKCGKVMQAVYSILAFGCLGGIFYFCSSLENNLISFSHAVLAALPLLAGFALFCSLAGAFRPYRYMKRKDQFNHRGHKNENVVTIWQKTECDRKSA